MQHALISSWFRDTCEHRTCVASAERASARYCKQKHEQPDQNIPVTCQPTNAARLLSIRFSDLFPLTIYLFVPSNVVLFFLARVSFSSYSHPSHSSHFLKPFFFRNYRSSSRFFLFVGDLLRRFRLAWIIEFDF